jgi:hypothetical protein
MLKCSNDNAKLAHPMLLSINQYSELTNISNRTIAKVLQDQEVTHGERGALLYDSAVALPVIYKADNLEAARAKQALSQASLNAVREEDLRKQRIPILVVTDVIDEIFQHTAATLKAAKNKVLTPKLINEIFEKFRNAPAELKW